MPLTETKIAQKCILHTFILSSIKTQTLPYDKGHNKSNK